MRESIYNNPMFASGLSELVSSVVGDPTRQAQNELAASQALNNNLTAKYREQMGVGVTDDLSPLSQMMIHALQAGPEYSGNAPGISAAVNQQEAGTLGKRIGPGRFQVDQRYINEAMEAIANGADPAKVQARLNFLIQNRVPYPEQAAETVTLSDLVANQMQRPQGEFSYG